MADWPGAILFDFDGVIVNSEPLHFFAFHEVMRAEKMELTEEEYYRELIGFDDRGCWKHIYEKRQMPLEPKTLLRLMTRKSEVMMDLIHRQQYQALPGVEEFVRGLWRHYPLGICSGALREEIEAMLEGVSLRDCFPTIVAAEDVTAGKPDPSGYLLAMKLISDRAHRRLEPKDCLIVEDAPSVCKSVRAVGFPVLAVTTSHAAEKFPDADWIVKSLASQEVSRAIPNLKLNID